MKKLLLTSLFLTSMVGILAANNLDRLKSLKGRWKFSIGDREEWASPDYDDSDWEEIWVPSRWEREGFRGYDGYAWYRKTFDGSDLENEKTIYLRLGYIDDVDEVFVNGHKVGFTGGFPRDFFTAYKARREYRIPSEYLNYEGENVIAVRVYDTIGEGGITSGDVGLYIPYRQVPNSLYLEGMWKIRVDDRDEFANEDYDDSDWENIMVPSNWRSIGLDDLNDFAWYRHQFEIPADLETEGMVMIAGRIDDFDEVFLNGTLIGETNDGRRIGRSRSFAELRVYDIPDGLLKKNGKNTIAVRVEDIGQNGGIYEGPVLILPQKHVSKIVRESSFFWKWD